jgi:hypothetical protein
VKVMTKKKLRVWTVSVCLDISVLFSFLIQMKALIVALNGLDEERDNAAVVQSTLYGNLMGMSYSCRVKVCHLHSV